MSHATIVVVPCGERTTKTANKKEDDMKILDEVPTNKRSKYPWDVWLDGQIRLLEVGVDFALASEGDISGTAALVRVRSYIYQTARVRGLGVTVNAQPNGDLVVQAYQKQIAQ